MKMHSCGVFLKFLVVVLCVCLFTSLTPVLGGPPPPPTPPIEYSDEVVHIRTAAELAGIGGSGRVYKTYVLDNDINLKEEWNPISGFLGTFDGQGHSINNLYVLKSSNRQYAGLFGSVSDNATIKNVGVNINSKGITAYNFYSFNAAYDLYRAEYYVVAGGLIGHSSMVTIENCYVTGDITATAKGERIAVAGGLVGYCSNITIKNCYITSDVTASSMCAYAGGSIGYGYNGYNSKNVATITDSYATGNILATSATNDGRPTVEEIRGYPRDNNRTPNADDTYAGGLVGYHCYNVAVKNSYTTGNITATAKSAVSFAGGLVGSSRGVTVMNSYATGDIIAKTKSTAGAGGLVGNGDIVTVMNSYATGGIIVSSTRGTTVDMYSDVAYGGGLIGRGDNIAVMNSYGTCDVSVTATSLSACAGGLIGWGRIVVTAVNCYAIGGVIATITTNRDSSFVGGLIGKGDATVRSCYSLSTQKIIGGKVNEMGTVLTPEEMKNQRSFTGWDFKTVWAIDSNINEGHPYLTMESFIEPTPTETTPNDTWGLFGSFWFFILFVVVVLGVVGVVYAFLEKKMRQHISGVNYTNLFC